MHIETFTEDISIIFIRRWVVVGIVGNIILYNTGYNHTIVGSSTVAVVAIQRSPTCSMIAT